MGLGIMPYGGRVDEFSIDSSMAADFTFVQRVSGVVVSRNGDRIVHCTAQDVVDTGLPTRTRIPEILQNIGIESNLDVDPIWFFGLGSMVGCNNFGDRFAGRAGSSELFVGRHPAIRIGGNGDPDGNFFPVDGSDFREFFPAISAKGGKEAISSVVRPLGSYPSAILVHLPLASASETDDTRNAVADCKYDNMEPGTKVSIRYQARLAWITAWRYGGGIPLKSNSRRSRVSCRLVSSHS